MITDENFTSLAGVIIIIYIHTYIHFYPVIRSNFRGSEAQADNFYPFISSSLGRFQYPKSHCINLYCFATEVICTGQLPFMTRTNYEWTAYFTTGMHWKTRKLVHSATLKKELKPIMTSSEWVCRFLMAHQHKKTPFSAMQWLKTELGLSNIYW